MQFVAENILLEIYNNLLIIIHENFPHETIESFAVTYPHFSYYDGSFTFTKIVRTARNSDVLVRTSRLPITQFYFMEIGESLSGKGISSTYDSAELIELLPTRKNIIRDLLMEL